MDDFFVWGFCGGCGLVFVVGCDLWDRVILDGGIEYFAGKECSFVYFLKVKINTLFKLKKLKFSDWPRLKSNSPQF